MKDKNGKLINEGDIVKTGSGTDSADYSIVTDFKGKLIVFGRYLSSWVFVANNDMRSPYLEVVGKL